MMHYTNNFELLPNKLVLYKSFIVLQFSTVQMTKWNNHSYDYASD